jgi:hypothetical protein
MAKRNGGIIGPSNVPNPFIAKGVWKLRDAFNYIKAGLWPSPLGYQVNNSLRFNSGSSDFLERTLSGTSTNRKLCTFSYWVKRSDISDTNQGCIGGFLTNSSGQNLQIGFFNNGFYAFYYDGTITRLNLVSSALARDVSAWYNVVVAIDTTQATTSDRTKMYVNGVQVTSFTTSDYPVQNVDFPMTNGFTTHIGKYTFIGSTTEYFSGYMSDVFFIDGQALTPSSFGQTDATTGIWTPIAYTGSFGTNGFELEFKNSAALGTDSSGNVNNFTVNNLTSVDQSTDTPTNNFATLNPLVNYQAYPPVLTEGNLKNTSNANGSNGGTSPSTIVVSQGKWYAEMKVGANIQNGTAFGIVTDSYRFDYQNDAAFYTSASFSSVAYVGDGRKVISNTFSSYGATFTTNDIIGIAVDLDNDTVTFYKNGVSQGVISTTLTGGYFICCYGYSSSVQEINFGSPPYAGGGYTDAGGFGNFSYQPPSGYYSLCTRTLAALG